ncbi:hypothetical protein UB46_23625 [Burkholderiaceae bacterium 16]|nr:hypothetical protein UB46_23625 [Burkholderiaceae bacterium 16]
MTQQLSLELATQDDLARFRIPHHGKHIVYGDVSRRMGQLRRQRRWAELAELVDVAAELYKAPEWRRIFAEWRVRDAKRTGVDTWPY